jgi:hypothetical protein
MKPNTNPNPLTLDNKEVAAMSKNRGSSSLTGLHHYHHQKSMHTVSQYG